MKKSNITTSASNTTCSFVLIFLHDYTWSLGQWPKATPCKYLQHQPHVIPSQSSIPASAASNLDRAEEHVLCVLHEHGKTVELLLLEVLCDSNRHVMQSAYQIHQKSAAVMTVLFFVPNSNRLHLHYPRGYITVPKIKK